MLSCKPPSTTVSDVNGFISCAPYNSMVDGSNPIDYVFEQSDPVCAITPYSGYHVSDVLVGLHGLLMPPPTSVGALWSYGFPNIWWNMQIEASFAANHIWLVKNGAPLQTVSTTITAALPQAASGGYDEIRIESGAYLEWFGLDCSSNFGAVTPKLSGGWPNAFAQGTKPTVIAPKLTISGNCALIIDEITIQ